MLKMTKQSLLNGTVIIEKDGTEIVVATVSATLQEDGTSSVNRYIQNNSLYLANRKTVDDDFKSFDASIVTAMKPNEPSG